MTGNITLVNIATPEKSRQQLRFIAADTGEQMCDIMARLIETEYEKVHNKLLRQALRTAEHVDLVKDAKQ